MGDTRQDLKKKKIHQSATEGILQGKNDHVFLHLSRLTPTIFLNTTSLILDSIVQVLPSPNFELRDVASASSHMRRDEQE